MAAVILRVRGLTSRLLQTAAGFKQSKFRPWRREGADERLEGFCQVLVRARHRQQGSLPADPSSRADRPGGRQVPQQPQADEAVPVAPLVTAPLES